MILCRSHSPRVEYDMTSIRVQGGERFREENFFKGPVTSPVAALVPKSMLPQRLGPDFRSWSPCWKDPERKTGWSRQLNPKYLLGKQTGFPPVVARPRQTRHQLLPLTSHPAASGGPQATQQPAVIGWATVIHKVEGLIRAYDMQLKFQVLDNLASLSWHMERTAWRWTSVGGSAVICSYSKFSWNHWNQWVIVTLWSDSSTGYVSFHKQQRAGNKGSVLSHWGNASWIWNERIHFHTVTSALRSVFHVQLVFSPSHSKLVFWNFYMRHNEQRPDTSGCFV